MKNNSKRVLYLLLLFGLNAGVLTGQFKMNNIAEYQLGNIPEVEPRYQGSLYDQLNMGYKYKKISLFTRVEQYYPTFDDESSYTQLSQYKVQYASDKFHVETGNIYTTLGRGLLFRSYEIPSSIYENRGYRVRYGFYKDLLGFSAKYNSKYFGIKLVRGKVLSVELPPVLEKENRRLDLIEGGEFDLRLKKQSLGLIVMRHSNSSLSNFYNSIYYNGKLKDFTIYAEIAQRTDSLDSFFNFNGDQAFGAYTGINYTGENLGFTLELKNYRNFYIGAGVNDPPTLVKEHSSRLLNRSTHVPLINHETGYQAEAYYLFPDLSSLTFNHSFAENKLGGSTYNFFEFYAEYEFAALTFEQVKVFADYAQDPIFNEPIRYTGGLLFDIGHNRHTSSFDFESQYIHDNSANESINFYNFLFSYSLAKSGKYSFTLLVETSGDPLLTDELLPETKYFPSLSIAYYIDKHNQLSVFAGKRRGGPACSSGVCYEVLDFQGLELRLTTRF